MLLNHNKIDNYTFAFAVYGGNIEIIKIVDQQMSSNSGATKIILTIQKHRNNLFDWILEQKISNITEEMLKTIINKSVINGNIHTTLELINNYDLLMDGENIIKITSNYGFYNLTKLLVEIIELKEKETKSEGDK